jgi:hypothetical protein
VINVEGNHGVVCVMLPHLLRPELLGTGYLPHLSASAVRPMIASK